MSRGLDRRGFLTRAAALGATLSLGGCDALSRSDWFRRVLEGAETLTEAAQRALLGETSLAREFDEADISPDFRANGSTNPQTAEYRRLATNGFADWRLAVDGLVKRPMRYSLADLRNMPSRTQITRHDCVEGWSSIGKWTGVPLAHVLGLVELRPEARFVVFHCADDLGATLSLPGTYYESIGLEDAFHPQTILAYGMNGDTLPVPHGAPLRVRVERQLGYKMAKYLMRIEAVASLDDIAGGRGGYWEDRGYEWYAGI